MLLSSFKRPIFSLYFANKIKKIQQQQKIFSTLKCTMSKDHVFINFSSSRILTVSTWKKNSRNGIIAMQFYSVDFQIGIRVKIQFNIFRRSFSKYMYIYVCYLLLFLQKYLVIVMSL